MTRPRVVSICALLLMGGLLACAGQQKPASPAPATASESPAARYARDPAAIDRGRLIFIGSCGGYCHDAHGAEREAPSLFDCTWKHGGSDEEIFRTISGGVKSTRMPPWATGLPGGEDDIWKVIAYLRSASTCATGPGAPAH